jgi:hypothetical protein
MPALAIDTATKQANQRVSECSDKHNQTPSSNCCCCCLGCCSGCCCCSGCSGCCRTYQFVVPSLHEALIAYGRSSCQIRQYSKRLNHSIPMLHSRESFVWFQGPAKHIARLSQSIPTDWRCCTRRTLVFHTLVTYAVNPTADEPLPEVYMPLGAILCTYCSSCDLLVPGSPTRRTLISLRNLQHVVVVIVAVVVGSSIRTETH